MITNTRKKELRRTSFSKLKILTFQSQYIFQYYVLFVKIRINIYETETYMVEILDLVLIYIVQHQTLQFIMKHLLHGFKSLYLFIYLFI